MKNSTLQSILLVLLAIFISLVIFGCATKPSATSAKNKDIIEVVHGESFIYPNVFRDTETGREYIVFRRGESITVTPRLEKEDKE